jgi:hypothetical protein
LRYLSLCGEFQLMGFPQFDAFISSGAGRRQSYSAKFFPARPITTADLATLTERVRRRVVRWFRMQRLSIRRGKDGRIAHVRYVLPRHEAANWVGPGRGRKSTRPGVVATSG